MKNASLKQISLIAAAIIGVLSACFATALFLFQYLSYWWIIPFAFVVTFVISLVTIYYLIDEFVYRRIKVLYKTIHQLKSGNTTLSNDNIDDPLGEVAQEVELYSQKKASEIAELKKMEQYRREFLGDVSHELKTPIFNTQGYIETLINGAINNPNVNVSYLQKASRNLDRLTSIVESLITISENESGNLKIDNQKFEIVKLIKEVIEANEMSAEVKDIKIEFKKDSPQSRLVKGDPLKIEAVLNNLLINAIKYGHDEGHVWFGIYNMDDKILIEVTDDGPGIDQKHLPRLFDRFYRIDKHRSRFEGGNGLGLSICKHIIDAHQQTIHVRSTVGVGTTFGFTLNKA